MDEYNINFNENQNIDFNNNANVEQNVAPQETQINQADLYAPYNQPQAENIQESVPQQSVYKQNNANDYYQPQQNVNQQGFYDNNIPQSNNSYFDYNQQQQYNQNNPYGGTYNQSPYVQNNPNNQYREYNQPPQYNAPYYNQQYPMYNFQEKPKGFAIASMILGICSTLCSCCVWFLTLFTSITGLVLGIVSLKRNEDGKGMAIAGIILSSVGILFSILAMIINIFALIEGDSFFDPYDYYNYY